MPGPNPGTGGVGGSSARSQAAASKARVNPLWWHYACATVVVAVIVGNGLRWLFLDWADPYRCSAMLNTGQWMDPGKWKQWQPEGCYHKALKHDAYVSCLTKPPAFSKSTHLSPGAEKRQVLFIGDSSVRQLFFAVVRLIDGGKGAIKPEWASEGEKHSDRRLTFYEGAGTEHERALELEFWWDPYLNATKTQSFIRKTSATPASVLVLGSGLWYLRQPTSGGLAAWGEMIHETFDALRLSQGSPLYPLQQPWDAISPFTAVSSPTLPAIDTRSLLGKSTPRAPGIADTIIFLPIVEAVQTLLSPSRAETILHTDIEAMNADLLARLTHPTPPPVIIPTVFNKMLVPEQTEDGLHFSDGIMDRQAEILLGWRCNDAIGKRATAGSCCKRYNWVRPVQAMVLGLFVVWAPMALVLGPRLHPSSPLHLYLPGPALATSLSSFGLAIGYLFFADRTTLFQKENKVYDATVFGALTAASLIAGLVTVKNGGKDLGFLNRDITDEWKGWMQIAILIYHFFGASKISGIYNPIRVLVAAYLFMTGYGHFFYYYKKADFGFNRVAAVLVRLNLLSVVLPYTMNADYAFYYFAPLVSWWYIIIYTTMALGSKYNDRAFFLIPKLLLFAGGITAFMHYTWIMESIFGFLNTVFRIQWSAREWSFRVTLDLFIVWAGMLSAYGYIKAKEHSIPDKPWFGQLRIIAFILSALGLGWYFWFELRYDKFTYNGFHPYVSIIPILSFVFLRNATPLLRSTSSRLFTFIGQCSLETFILQFHGWLASDTKGILLVLPGTRWRAVNIVISTIAFIWLSHRVAGATGEITEWMVGGGKKALPMPVTAAGGGGVEVVRAVVEGTEEGAKSGIQESIPLMGQDEKGLNEEGNKVAPQKTLPPPSPSLDRRSSWPDWMSATARSLPGRRSVHVNSMHDTQWTDNPLTRLVRKVAQMAEKRNSVKLGLVLLGLWVLNWLY